MSGSLTYFKHGVFIDVFFSHGENINRTEDFAYALSNFTAAGINRCSVAIPRVLTLPEKTNDAFSIELYAKVLLRQATTGKLFAILIHAPLSTLFEAIPNQGWRLKEDTGIEIAALYSTMAGETFWYVNGFVVGSTKNY